MSVPLCAQLHHPVHAQRWRQQPWASISGQARMVYRCPVCKCFIYILPPQRSPLDRRGPKRRSFPRAWWRVF